ncbi:hypothetical protein SJAV_19190 [Sulfurisphaera javensis]|uniref:Uncharacterized protein n=1 Tax=Sulfurisphaera javensis TaxID=2049879 RepID=A0AAT9GTL2_9CREN
MEANGTVKIEDGKIRKGSVFERYENRKIGYYFSYNISFVVDVSISPEGNVGKSYDVIGIPVHSTTKLIAVETLYYNKEIKEVLARCKKIKILDPFNLGIPNVDCEVSKDKDSIKVIYYPNPPLQPGHIIKWGAYFWHKGVYYNKLEEILNEQGVDYEGSGAAISDPTYYLKIRVELPWTPTWVDANEATILPVNRLSLDNIKAKHNFTQRGNILILEVINPEFLPYIIRWRPPS